MLGLKVGRNKYSPSGQLTVCHKVINTIPKISAKRDLFYRKGYKKIEENQHHSQAGGPNAELLLFYLSK